MAKRLLLEHYRGALAPVNDVPMDQWILHGNEKIKHDLTADHAEAAIQISLELLRVILRDRPDLLSMKDAAERSITAILQVETSV
jgi:hypothetical protein